MQQLRRMFKLLSSLSAIALIFTLILMITLVALNQHGFGIPQEQSTASTDYFSQKYLDELSLGNRKRFYFVIFALICLTCIVLAVFWGFSTQIISNVPQDNSYFKVYFILISCVIIFLIPVAGYYTSRTIETQPKSSSELAIGILIMVQSFTVLILATVSWVVIFKNRPLQQQLKQNLDFIDDAQKKYQTTPKIQVIHVLSINKQLEQPEISCHPFPHLEESLKNVIEQHEKQQNQTKPEINTFDPFPTKKYTSRPIPLFSEYSDFTKKPQMQKFFERRNHEQKLRRLRWKQQIEKRKRLFRSPSCIIPQQTQEKSNMFEEKWAKIPSISKYASQYLQQTKPTSRLQADEAQDELQPQLYKRQPKKITNLFNPPRPLFNGPQQEVIMFQALIPAKQRVRRRLFNIVQWNLKEKILSSRVKEPSIYESQIHKNTSTKQSELAAILKRRYNSSSQLE